MFVRAVDVNRLGSAYVLGCLGVVQEASVMAGSVRFTIGVCAGRLARMRLSTLYGCGCLQLGVCMVCVMFLDLVTLKLC